MRCPRQLCKNLLLHLLNSLWLQFARSARDQLNRWIITFTASPAWAWPTPRRRWTSSTADIARTYRPACSGPTAIWFAAGLTAASVPLVGPPSPGGGSAVLPRRQTQRSPHSPVSFPEDCFRPPSNIEEFVSFGQEEGDDDMSISASEREDWAGSESDHLDSSGPSDLQEELMRVLSKAVQELELTWSPPEEPVRSKLGSWYFRSTQKADSRASVPFFPDVHEQLVKMWSAPQSARVHSNTQAIYSHVDGADITPPTRVRTSSPYGSRTRDSGAGGGRSNKVRQRLQPLASVARAPLLRSGE